MKGIKQKANFQTGERPTKILEIKDGKLVGRDKRFRTHKQCTQTGCEIFITDDDNAVKDYEGIEGVEILQDVAAINARTLEMHDDNPRIENESLLVEYIRQAGVDITDIGGKTGTELADALSKKGCPGIVKSKRPCCPVSGEEL